MKQINRKPASVNRPVFSRGFATPFLQVQQQEPCFALPLSCQEIPELRD